MSEVIYNLTKKIKIAPTVGSKINDDKIGKFIISTKVKLKELKISLDFSLDCKCELCVYLAICKHCPSMTQFYFGQSINPNHIRFNGHRGCFKLLNDKYFQSALSQHIFEKHPELFENRLKNFSFGIVKQSSPKGINRLEDYYIYSTKADVVSLNRYKVTS